MPAAGEKEVEVIHRPKARIGVAGGQCRTFEHDGVKPGLRQRCDGGSDGSREQDKGPGAPSLAVLAHCGPSIAAAGVARALHVGRLQASPEQRGDALTYRSRAGEIDIGAAGEGARYGFEIGRGAARRP